MIIEFSVTNFRSIKKAQKLSMVAASYVEHIDSNTFDPGLKGFDERLLISSAIYGPNAAGKTNLLFALQFMQMFVLNSATGTMGVIYNPFKFSAATRNAPSEFVVTFVEHGTRYEYGFEITSDRVEKEWLIEFAHPRGRRMFDRKYNHKDGNYKWNFSTFLKGQREVWKKTTRPNALFLSTAIQLNSTQLAPVFDWFQKRLVIVAGQNRLNASLTLNLLDEHDGKETLLSFMREADFGITDLAVKRVPVPPRPTIIQGASVPPIIEQRPGQATPNFVKITLSHFSDDKKYADLDLSEESNGTRNFFMSIGAWINVFRSGQVFLMDELESSLHPLLAGYLIKLFHSKEHNQQNAQLIFTTQSINLLDLDLFRRDQIWFVEQNKDEGSHLYSLSDFKSRNDENLLHRYLQGRYGALPILNEPKV